MSQTKRLKLPVEPEGIKKNNNSSPRARHLLKKYGITDEQFQSLLLWQKGCCAVCGRHQDVFKSRLCVDHDHTTGAIRGLLCTYCNRRIVGRYRKGNDSLSLLLAAYNYLNRDYPGWVVPPKIKKRKRRARRKRI